MNENLRHRTPKFFDNEDALKGASEYTRREFDINELILENDRIENDANLTRKELLVNSPLP